AFSFAAHPADAERTVLTIFQADALREAREPMPGIRRGISRHTLADAERFEGDWRGLVEYTAADRAAIGLKGLTEELTAQVREQEIELHVWPMRSLQDMQQAVRLQADGTTADDPQQAMQCLRDVTG